MRLESGRCDVIDMSIAQSQLDNASSSILQRDGMIEVALPGNVVTWAAARRQTLKWILAGRRFSRDWRHWRALQDGAIPEDHPLIGICRLDNGADLASALIAACDSGERVADAPEDIASLPSYVIRCAQRLPVTFRPSIARE
ncbi:hypothetical protein [Xanthomonas graminis]|nr:hypothetical protein [Xanthomonas translucens]